MPTVPGIGPPLTLGAVRGYDATSFGRDLRQACVTPHMAQNPRHSAIDGPTTRHEALRAVPEAPTQIEEPFGWGKTCRWPLPSTVCRGVERVRSRFVLTMAANLARLPRLLED